MRTMLNGAGMCVAGVVLALGAVTRAQQPAPAPQVPAAGMPSSQGMGGGKKPLVLARSIEEVLADRIAKQLVVASPMAPAGDARARDEAGVRMAACDDLMNAANGRILWGGFNPEQGYDPEGYRLNDRAHDDWSQLTELNPMVWAKLYLSTFMFPGPYTIHREGKLTVLELDAQFRSEMDAGEYPYPFWHSPNKWTAYVKVEKVMFVFEPGRLVAAMRRSPNPLSVKQVRKQWDTKWLWTDKDGNPQPRVALYSYLFSKDNPHVAELEKSFRALETNFRSQNCMLCHEPDNRSRINDLLLLNYPNQALVMRRSLVAILEGNQMPPGSELAHEPQGVQDMKALREMTRLARAFEKEADEAFAFEAGKRARTPAVEEKK